MKKIELNGMMLTGVIAVMAMLSMLESLVMLPGEQVSAYAQAFAAQEPQEEFMARFFADHGLLSETPVYAEAAAIIAVRDVSEVGVNHEEATVGVTTRETPGMELDYKEAVVVIAERAALAVGLDYEEAAVTVVRRTVAVDVVDYTQAAAVQALRWEAMARFYADNGLLNGQGVPMVTVTR